MDLEPDIGQKLVQAVHRVGREPAEDVPEVGEGVEAEVLAGGASGKSLDGGPVGTAVRTARGWEVSL